MVFRRGRVSYISPIFRIAVAIRIYTLAGDHVDTIEHDGQSYGGDDVNWYKQYAAGDKVFQAESMPGTWSRNPTRRWPPAFIFTRLMIRIRGRFPEESSL